LVLVGLIFGYSQLNMDEQTEYQDSWLAVTILKTQHLEADEGVKPVGGLIETKEYINDIVYPEWKISLPLSCLKITQDYRLYHHGFDLIPCDNNYNILSVDEGKIVKAGWDGGYGYRIEVLHKNEMISTYSHLSKMNFSVGNKIERGAILGVIGSTGQSTGIHLHFEVIYQGIKLNPNLYFR